MDLEQVPHYGHKFDNGDSLWEKANSLHLANEFDEAEKIYVQLLEQNPQNGGLMATLGSLYCQTGKIGLAIHLLECAVERGVSNADVLTNLGVAYKQAGLRDKSIETLEASIKDDPTPEALTNYSGMFVESGESEKCIELCERAIAMNPDMPIAHWNLAIALLSEGKWDRAWDEHEWGLKSHGVREDRKVIDLPTWDGKASGTVLVYGEQGLGDEIMFASMLPEVLKTNEVVFETHGRLETLMKKAFPSIPVYGTRTLFEVDWAANHKLDYRIAIGSLGKFYRRSADSFPGTTYMKADPIPRGDKFRIGISWVGGGAKQGRVVKRSVPLAWWKSILDIEDVEFVSLQYNDCDREIEEAWKAGHDIKVMDEYAKALDYYEAARLIASCDLVISVCNSCIHLAGALGVPCWVMTPCYPAWRYQNKGKMPWYKSVRLYRQPTPDVQAWIPVVDRIALDLNQYLERKVLKVA